MRHPGRRRLAGMPFRIADGRIAEQWCMFDDLARLQQLRVSPEHLRQVLKI